MKTAAVVILGWALMAVGILGLLLPIAPGIPFLMAGLAILSTRSRFIKRRLLLLKERYPRQYDRVIAWRRRILGWFKRRPTAKHGD